MSFGSTTLTCLLAASILAPDPVRAAADKAAVLVGEGRYEEAMDTLDAAQKQQADPVFVFMRGVVEEERGNCQAAITHYDEFLKLGVPEVDAKEARRRRERCQRLLERPAPSPPPPVVETPADVAPRTQPPRPWYTDPAGLTLTVVGVAGVAVGAALYTQATADARAARDATVLQLYDSRATRAERWSRAGIATMSVAGALLVAGIVRYAIVGSRPRRARRANVAQAHVHYFETLSRLP